MIKYAVLFTAVFCLTVHGQQNHHNLLIGTYTNSCKSDGIYVYDFNSDTGDFEFKNSTKEVINPSFLTLSPDKKFVYAVNENGDNSKMSSFKYDSGSLELLDSQDSKGNDPCHIICDDTYIVLANYSEGNVVIFDKGKYGFTQAIKHNGKSINKSRQESSHMHMVQFSPDKKYIFATDLGADCVYIYTYKPELKPYIMELSTTVKLSPGSGPRHFTFSPDGKFMYLLNELAGTLIAFKYKDGDLEVLQETSVVSRKVKGASAAEIAISADGKFLYATNRGDANTISCFMIKKNGKLKLVETISTLGNGPRSFTIDPSGKFLLVAHQYSNDVVVFKVDKETGMLSDTGKKLELCSPVCLVFE